MISHHCQTCKQDVKKVLHTNLIVMLITRVSCGTLSQRSDQVQDASHLQYRLIQYLDTLLQHMPQSLYVTHAYM